MNMEELEEQLKLVFYKVPNLKILRTTKRLSRLEYLWTEWKREPTQGLSNDILTLFQVIKEEYVGYQGIANELGVIVNGVLVSKYKVVGVYKYKEDKDGLYLVALDKRYKFMPYSLSVEYQLGDSTPIEHGDVYVLTKDGLLPGDRSKYVYFSWDSYEGTYSFSEDVIGAY